MKANFQNIYASSRFASLARKLSFFCENSFVFKQREYFKNSRLSWPELWRNSKFFSTLSSGLDRLRPQIQSGFLDKLTLLLFFIIFLFTPFKSWLKNAYPSNLYTFLVPVALVLIAAWLLARKRSEKMHFTLADLGIIFIVFSILVSSFASLFTYGQVKNIYYEGFIWLSYIAVFYIGRTIFQTKKQLKVFLAFNLFIVFVVSLIGIGQLVLGVQTPQWIEGFELIKTRIFSTLDNPIILSGYLNIFFFIALGIFFGLKRLKSKLLLLPLFAVMLVALVLTFSRSGWIGLVLGLLFFFFIYKPKYILGIIPLSIFSLLVIPKSYFYRLTDIFDSRYNAISSVSGRTWTLHNVFHILPHHLLFGVGPGMYGGEVAFKTSPSIVYMEGIQGGAVPMQNTDNQFLQILIEQGLLGILAFIFFALAILCSGLIVYQHLNDRLLKMLALGITTAFFAFLVQSVFTDSLQFPQMALTMFGFLGILLSLPRIKLT